MVHDQSPLDDVTLEPHKPFKLEVKLEDTVGSVKAKILQHKDIPLSEESMQKLKLVYNGIELKDDHVALKTHYFARMHLSHLAHGKHGFKWSFPYIGIVWVTPNFATPSNDAIAQYSAGSTNVIRRSQGEICEAYYDNIETEAESLVRAARTAQTSK